MARMPSEAGKEDRPPARSSLAGHQKDAAFFQKDIKRLHIVASASVALDQQGIPGPLRCRGPFTCCGTLLRWSGCWSSATAVPGQPPAAAATSASVARSVANHAPAQQALIAKARYRHAPRAVQAPAVPPDGSAPAQAPNSDLAHRRAPRRWATCKRLLAGVVCEAGKKASSSMVLRHGRHRGHQIVQGAPGA